MSDSKKPKQDAIDTAKAYVLARLALQRNIVSAVRQIVGRLVDGAVQYAFTHKLTAVKILRHKHPKFRSYLITTIHQLLALIRQQIEEYVYEDCTEDEQDELEQIVFGEVAGLTFDERINIYADRLAREMEIMIAAELFARAAQDDATKDIKATLDHPYLNEVVKEAMREGLPIVIPSYGRGVSTSMTTAISTLASYTVARGVMRKLYLANDNAFGWYVMRGSSYPCTMCDNEVGWHHDTSDLPPYHPNCCCIAIPVIE
jgi:hypothetical protein